MKILTKLSAWLWAVLKPLGAWGIFAIAGIDGAGLPLPGAVDAVLATYVYSHDPLHAWVYVLMAAAGSTAGCIVPYVIGYIGGEVLLERRMPKWKFEKIRRSFEGNKFLALAVPAMMPPPFPFKAFVLAAAVFEMKLWHYLVAIFTGRIVRYTVIALLTVEFGPQVVLIIATLLRRHLAITLMAMAAVVAVIFLLLRLRRSPGEAVVE